MRIAPGKCLSALAGFAASLAVLCFAGRAHAVPAFAAQTGQPCQTCHVGGFGPQLTPYGRNFKLNGYTQRDKGFTVPVSLMAIASYVRTAKAQNPAPAPGFSGNDNFALDQISLFVAGGLGAHLGGFIQTTTYDGVARAWTWDNLDLRATTKLKAKGADLVLGASVNNSPTVQDAWNTLGAWGFPFTSSSLAPSPATAPLLSGALAQESLGLTGYAWIDNHVFVEAGAYGSPGATSLRRLGADPTAPGNIEGEAPYGRLAWQGQVRGGTLELGAFGMRARIHPGLDRTTPLTDLYADLGLDASFQRPDTKGDVFSINFRYTREWQDLAASCDLAGGPAGCAANDLSDVRGDVSYYWRNKLGATVGVFDTFGSANPTLYASNRAFRPDSAGVILQLDATPFGDRPQPRRRLNLRVGLQYWIYTQFNGSGTNFDRMGRNASDQNTVRVFTWIAF
ncbi:MAG TPA: hypothetical protein VGF42_04110 [Caulobacteraceae bacterium]